MKKFRCTVCGEVVEGEHAPEKCPLCKAPASKFVEVVETEEYLIIACPQDKNSSEEDKVTAYDQILMELKGEEMTAMMEEYKESLNIEWNDGAIKRFAPEKMLIGY